jgi:hypothetical protein
MSLILSGKEINCINGDKPMYMLYHHCFPHNTCSAHSTKDGEYCDFTEEYWPWNHCYASYCVYPMKELIQAANIRIIDDPDSKYLIVAEVSLRDDAEVSYNETKRGFVVTSGVIIICRKKIRKFFMDLPDIFAALTIAPMAICYLSRRMRNKREIALHAVRHGCPLYLLQDRFWNDTEIVTIAVLDHPDNVEYASERLRSDLSFAKMLTEKHPDCWEVHYIDDDVLAKLGISKPLE